MASSLQTTLVVLHYAYPAVIFLYFLVASLVSVCNVQTGKKAVECKKNRPSQRTVYILSALSILTFAGQLGVIGTQALLSRVWPTEDDIIIGHLSCILVFGILVGQHSDDENATSYPFVGSWLLGFLFEIIIISLSAFDDVFVAFQSFDIIDMALVSTRCLIFLILAGLYSFATTDKVGTDEERQSLLPKDTTTCPGSSAGQSQNSQESGYGSTLQAEEESTEEAPEYNWERREREAKEAMKKRLEEGGNWIEYAKGFKVRFPACFTFDQPRGLYTYSFATSIANTIILDTLSICLARWERWPSSSRRRGLRLPPGIKRPSLAHPPPDWYHHGQLERRQHQQPMAICHHFRGSSPSSLRIGH